MIIARNIAFLLLTFSLVFGQRIRDDVQELKKIGVDEHLGGYIPLDVPVITTSGDTVQLSTVFQTGKPVLFTLAYYDCPMLCSMVLDGVSQSINTLNWESRNRYQVITVSIDAGETPLQAKEKREAYINRAEDASLKYNWSFFTAPQSTIDTLSRALGFQYYYVPETDEFAHPAVVFILSPEGKISRYLYGLNYEPKDLKFSLMEASDGKIGSTVEQLLLFCYHYDATENTYVLFARNIMRIGGVITMILLGGFLFIYWKKEKKLKMAKLN